MGSPYPQSMDKEKVVEDEGGGEEIIFLHFESTQMLKVHEVKWQNGIPLCIYICICIYYYFWVNCELEYVRRIIKQR